MLIQIFIGFIGLMTSCTYNVSMAHTSGYASQVSDDSLSPDNDISPQIDLKPAALK